MGGKYWAWKHEGRGSRMPAMDLKSSFPPPLSAFGDPTVTGTIEVEVPAEGVLLIAVRRKVKGHGAVVAYEVLDDPLECDPPIDLLDQLDKRARE